jgi:hypothetical protein
MIGTHTRPADYVSTPLRTEARRSTDASLIESRNSAHSTRETEWVRWQLMSLADRLVNNELQVHMPAQAN